MKKPAFKPQHFVLWEYRQTTGAPSQDFSIRFCLDINHHQALGKEVHGKWGYLALWCLSITLQILAAGTISKHELKHKIKINFISPSGLLRQENGKFPKMLILALLSTQPKAKRNYFPSFLLPLTYSWTMQSSLAQWCQETLVPSIDPSLSLYHPFWEY